MHGQTLRANSNAPGDMEWAGEKMKEMFANLAETIVRVDTSPYSHIFR